MYCKECGEQISSSNRFCSECGSSTSEGSNHNDSNPYPTQRVGTDSMCVGSAIVGIVAVLFPLFGITGVVAIACGVRGRLNTDETGMGGRGLAIFGIVLGSLSILLAVLASLTLASVTR